MSSGEANTRSSVWSGAFIEEYYSSRFVYSSYCLECNRLRPTGAGIILFNSAHRVGGYFGKFGDFAYTKLQNCASSTRLSGIQKYDLVFISIQGIDEYQVSI